MQGSLVFLKEKRPGHFERRPLNFPYPYTWLQKKKRRHAKTADCIGKENEGGWKKKEERKEKKGGGRNGKEKEERIQKKEEKTKK